MLANQMLGDYEILELGGKGGQGEVYKALDTKLKRPVAVKIFTAEGEHRRQKLASFKNEARLASSLNHPNICTIYGFVEEENHTFIVMEYVEGKNLFELAFGRPLEIKSALEIIFQVTDALNAAHARGIVHRDIKPRNVMVTSDGQALVLDFGLAKLLENEDGSFVIDETDEIHSSFSEDIAESLFKTVDGMPYGSPTSSPPEMALGKPTDARGDVYSVGVLLYLLLTGTYPFLGKTIREVRDKVINEEPVPLAVARTVKGVIPLELIAIVRRALRKDPAERFQTMMEMRDRLLLALKEIEGDAKQISTFPNTSAPRFAPSLQKRLFQKPIFILSIFAALIITVVLLWYVFY
ncbi:MAG: serine/threonine-protein kinase [Pyrinomonadaceae bacterium]